MQRERCGEEGAARGLDSSRAGRQTDARSALPISSHVMAILALLPLPTAYPLVTLTALLPLPPSSYFS